MEKIRWKKITEYFSDSIVQRMIDRVSRQENKAAIFKLWTGTHTPFTNKSIEGIKKALNKKSSACHLSWRVKKRFFGCVEHLLMIGVKMGNEGEV